MEEYESENNSCPTAVLLYVITTVLYWLLSISTLPSLFDTNILKVSGQQKIFKVIF